MTHTEDLDLSQTNDVDFSQPTPPVPRPFPTCFDRNFLVGYQRGTLAYKYRDIPCLKDPIDLALYMKLIWEQKPRTIIEIGAFQGGSAIFYADLCQTYGLDTTVVTVDHQPIHYSLGPRARFIQADALHLESSPLHEALDSLPRPWLVIEDSAHTGEVTCAVVDYFEQRMQKGEVLIVEDGVVEDMGDNAEFHGGPNLAVHRLFATRPDSFRLMTEYTDFFGRNATYNPNGYLQKL